MGKRGFPLGKEIRQTNEGIDGFPLPPTGAIQGSAGVDFSASWAGKHAFSGRRYRQSILFPALDSYYRTIWSDFPPDFP